MTIRHHGAAAAIDCGTNSTRLLVVDGEGRPLDRRMTITRLGQGVDAGRRLEAAAIDRTLSVLREYREAMDQLGVTRVRMVATSAVRDAHNGREFLDAATGVVGSPAELLPGEEEGRLAYSGATAGLPAAAGDDVVVDIGGGSTELILQRRGRVDAVSMDLGCVRITERCLRHDPPTLGEIGAAMAEIEKRIDGALEAVPGLRSLRSGSRLIGLAGTVSTLSALQQGLPAYDREHLHHSVLAFDDVDRWCTTLIAEAASARARRPGMVEGREDVIPGGAMILRQVMGRLGARECLVSESDILDCLVTSLSQ